VPSDVPLDKSRQTAIELADRLEVEPDRAGFASVPESTLITAQGGGFQPLDKPTADDLIAVMRALDGRLRLGPVVDGDLHPWPVEEGLRRGAGRDLPLLVGATRQEFGGLAHANSHLFEDHDVAELLLQVGLDASGARRYADAMPDEHPADVVGQYVSDLMFRRRMVDWLALRREAAPTWAYDFAWPSAVSGVAEHCLDVPFVFDLLEDPDVTRVAGPNAPQALASRVHGDYVSFIRDGNPSWPSYADSQSVMVFDSDSRVVSGGYESARALTQSEGDLHE
jgi:para-nitrobenzyl esterase